MLYWLLSIRCWSPNVTRYVVMVSWFTRNYCACAPMLYISELCEDCAVANEIDYQIDYAWASIHDNGHVITACDVWLQQRICLFSRQLLYSWLAVCLRCLATAWAPSVCPTTRTSTGSMSMNSATMKTIPAGSELGGSATSCTAASLLSSASRSSSSRRYSPLIPFLHSENTRVSRDPEKGPLGPNSIPRRGWPGNRPAFRRLDK